jgi:hypothetical protein
MPENISTLNYVQQKKVKPKPEVIIYEALIGENHENALHFVNWLKENKMSPAWQVTNKWRSNFKGKGICHIFIGGPGKPNKVENGSWCVRIFLYDNLLGKINDEPFSEWVKEITIKNAKRCISCVAKCSSPGRSKIIYGKEIKNFCDSGLTDGVGTMEITNPNMEMTERIKSLILINKEVISDFA